MRVRKDLRVAPFVVCLGHGHVCTKLGYTRANGSGEKIPIWVLDVF